MAVCSYTLAADKAARDTKLSPGRRRRPELGELGHSKQSSFTAGKQGL